MIRSILLSIVTSILLWGCNSHKKNKATLDLPFYNRADYTPEWIETTDPKYDKIHTISAFKLVNQNGDTLTNEYFDGKVYATNFFFSVCPNVCPRMKKNLSIVQEEYLEDDRVKILSHTVMPWVDSVARLNEYAIQNDIKSEKWNLVTGKKKDIYQLARESYFADEGFDKTLTSEEDFLHTENVVLVDQKRRIRGVYNGTLPLEMKKMMEDIETLLTY